MTWRAALVPVVAPLRLLAQGQGFLAESAPRSLAQSTTVLASGGVYFVGIGLNQGDVVTNIHLRLISPLAVGVTACRVGLYDRAGNLLAQSADLGNSWESGAFKTHPLIAPYIVPTTGLYYVALFCTFITTAPTVVRTTGITGVFEAAAGGAILCGTQSGQVALPNPATITNSGSVSQWVAVS